MSKRHKWADVIIGFAEGKKIQFKYLDGEWKDWNNYTFPAFYDDDTFWRIKPAEPVVKWLWAFEAMKNVWNHHPNFMTEKQAQTLFTEENFRNCRYMKLDWSRTEIPSGE